MISFFLQKQFFWSPGSSTLCSVGFLGKTSRFINMIIRSSFKSPAMINEPADAQNIFADVVAGLPPPPWPGDPKVGL